MKGSEKVMSVVVMVPEVYTPVALVSEYPLFDAAVITYLYTVPGCNSVEATLATAPVLYTIR